MTNTTNAVNAALRNVPAAGAFGMKVFVSALHAELLRAGAPIELRALESFKQWLLVANREGRVTLARADLVGAMDPTLVRESEISHLGATFHFVLDSERDFLRRR